jgi:hypothetical protein
MTLTGIIVITCTFVIGHLQSLRFRTVGSFRFGIGILFFGTFILRKRICASPYLCVGYVGTYTSIHMHSHSKKTDLLMDTSIYLSNRESERTICSITVITYILCIFLDGNYVYKFTELKNSTLIAKTHY